jgi:hypothetical protein
LLKKRSINIGCGWLLLVAASVSAQSHAGLTPQNRQTEFNHVIESNAAAAIPTAQKIARLSQVLLGAPYVDGNLGEGAQGRYDQDPLSRFDVFDCTTYVEAVLAGALSQSVDEFLPNLEKIRYKNGQVSFVTRNHFPSADWLPNNRWMLTDLTQEIGGATTKFAHTVIDKKAWYQRMSMSRIQGLELPPEAKQKRLSALRKEGEKFAPEAVTTPYVPLTAVFQKKQLSSDELAQQAHQREQLQANTAFSAKAKKSALRELMIQQHLANSTINYDLLNRIPTGSVISMVRPDYSVKQWIGTNMNITHQAIAIQKNGRLYIRNASLIKKEVVDQDFVDYFSRYLESSSLKGFNVQFPTF